MVQLIILLKYLSIRLDTTTSKVSTLPVTLESRYEYEYEYLP